MYVQSYFLIFLYYVVIFKTMEAPKHISHEHFIVATSMLVIALAGFILTTNTVYSKPLPSVWEIRCTDVDGQDQTSLGTVKLERVNRNNPTKKTLVSQKTDACASTAQVREYSCTFEKKSKTNHITSKIIGCDTGQICKQGACIPAPISPTLAPACSLLIGCDPNGVTGVVTNDTNVGEYVFKTTHSTPLDILSVTFHLEGTYIAAHEGDNRIVATLYYNATAVGVGTVTGVENGTSKQTTITLKNPLKIMLDQPSQAFTIHLNTTDDDLSLSTNINEKRTLHLVIDQFVWSDHISNGPVTVTTNVQDNPRAFNRPLDTSPTIQVQVYVGPDNKLWVGATAQDDTALTKIEIYGNIDALSTINGEANTALLRTCTTQDKALHCTQSYSLDHDRFGTIYAKAWDSVGHSTNSSLIPFAVSAPKSTTPVAAQPATTTSNEKHTVPAIVITAEQPIAGSSIPQSITDGTQIGRFKIINNSTSEITITNLRFTDSGSHSGSPTFNLFVSDEGLGNFTSNLSATGASVNFQSLQDGGFSISGGSYRFVTIAIASTNGLQTGNSFSLSIASLGDAKYSVTESDLGYDGNGNGTLADTITGLSVDGRPTLGTLIKY